MDGCPSKSQSKSPETSLVYLHTDHLGAVVKATDEQGSVVWDVDRKPFGERMETVAVVEMLLGFPGQYFDQETNNYYNYFRDYDPATGRYLQSDPIGLDGGINTYSYAFSNPVVLTDRYGLFPGSTTVLCDLFPQLCGGANPGRCTRAQHRAYQNAVNSACKQKRACNPSQSCKTLASNLRKNARCAAARDTINLMCYGGGDSGHRQAAADARKAAKKCANQMMAKNCICPRN